VFPPSCHTVADKLNYAGWVLFVLSALAFAASGWRSADSVTLVGSLLFLGGCVLFMIPYHRRH